MVKLSDEKRLTSARIPEVITRAAPTENRPRGPTTGRSEEWTASEGQSPEAVGETLGATLALGCRLGVPPALRGRPGPPADLAGGCTTQQLRSPQELCAQALFGGRLGSECRPGLSGGATEAGLPTN